MTGAQNYNILRRLAFALTGGGSFDLQSGDVLKLVPITDDTGSINIGDGTTDMDVKWFGGTSAKYVLFDVGNSLLKLEDIDLRLGDNDNLQIGDNADVSLTWNGTYLQSNLASNAMWAGCPTRLQSNYLAVANDFEDDFHKYDSTATVGDWAENSAGGVGGTFTLTNTVAGGQLKILCAATDDDDGNQITQVSAPFFLAAGKHLWLEMRVKVKSEAAGNGLTQSDYYMGLASLGENLSAEADNLPADGVVFHKDDGDAGTIQCTASLGGVNTSTNADVGTFVEDTFITLGFYVNGVTSITPYVDGVAQTALAATTIPNDTSQGLIFGCRNGDATEKISLVIDYVKVVQLR